MQAFYVCFMKFYLALNRYNMRNNSPCFLNMYLENRGYIIVYHLYEKNTCQIERNYI